MIDSNQPNTTKPDSVGPDDTIIPGETATTGLDEGETGGRTKAPESDAPDGVEIGGPRVTSEDGIADDPAGEDPTDAGGRAKQGVGGKSDV